MGTFVYFVSCRFVMFLIFATIFKKKKKAVCCVLLLYLSFSVKLETLLSSPDLLALNYVLFFCKRRNI